MVRVASYGATAETIAIVTIVSEGITLMAWLFEVGLPPVPIAICEA
jgi:hypothetical protein